MLTKRKDSCAVVNIEELLDLKKEALQFSLNRIKSLSLNGTKRFSRLLSRGMEFEESRCYIPGDDVRSMDWKVTARTGRSHTKLFAEEKENKALVAVDMRRAMFFATEGVFKSVQAAMLASCFSWNALSHKHPVGGIIFTDETILEFKPSSLKKGIFPFLQKIAETSKTFLNQDSCKSPLDFEKTVHSLKKMAGAGSLIFLISDFRKMEENTKNALIQISKQSQLFLIFLYDKFECELPKGGSYPLIDGDSEGQFNFSDEKGLKEYQKQFLTRKETVSSLASCKNIHFIECSTKDNCIEVIKRYFN